MMIYGNLMCTQKVTVANVV